jgi:hypothetical protein
MASGLIFSMFPLIASVPMKMHPGKKCLSIASSCWAIDFVCSSIFPPRPSRELKGAFQSQGNKLHIYVVKRNFVRSESRQMPKCRAITTRTLAESKKRHRSVAHMWHRMRPNGGVRCAHHHPTQTLTRLRAMRL